MDTPTISIDYYSILYIFFLYSVRIF
ncbi:hypothetical protein CCOS01_02502 [Colletotrichum costaricense]|uniref:Uncharacterized protein n=1 Tax=Colletotrichum costaricense TaxID=1209916 RepID=A0AAI9Z9L2_9PEZI|nr:hypothetical protein CCOS01_02502 [Colletotrichum costaricense]